jgi:hypothetical protein
MTFLNCISKGGLIFIILTIPYSSGLLNFALAQKDNFNFGNQDMEIAGGQVGQVGQVGQGNAKSIGGVCCSNDPNQVSSSSDT